MIIVLSEANAGLAFGDDKRQKIVWVDEMDTEEAEEYARKLHPGVSDADLKPLFDKVGKLPLDILSSMTALKKGIPAAQIIEEAVLGAEKDLVAFTLKPLLAALMATPMAPMSEHSMVLSIRESTKHNRRRWRLPWRQIV